jgi:hypothetical protein
LLDETALLTRTGLTPQRDAPVSVMVETVIREDLLPNQEGTVLALTTEGSRSGIRERLAQSHQAFQSGCAVA